MTIISQTVSVARTNVIQYNGGRVKIVPSSGRTTPSRVVRAGGDFDVLPLVTDLINDAIALDNQRDDVAIDDTINNEDYSELPEP